MKRCNFRRLRCRDLVGRLGGGVCAAARGAVLKTVQPGSVLADGQAAVANVIEYTAAALHAFEFMFWSSTAACDVHVCVAGMA